MPIRFRCAYCNQLLGISRRKAGTVVRCPHCQGQVVVPTLEEAGGKNEQEPLPPAGGASQPLFEGNEIDKLLEGTAGDQPSALPPNARTVSPVAPPAPGASAAVAPLPTGGAAHPTVAPAGLTTMTPAGLSPGGIYVSSARATLFSVLAVVGLAVAFGIGLILGMWMGAAK